MLKQYVKNFVIVLLCMTTAAHATFAWRLQIDQYLAPYFSARKYNTPVSAIKLVLLPNCVEKTVKLYEKKSAHLLAMVSRIDQQLEFLQFRKAHSIRGRFYQLPTHWFKSMNEAQFHEDMNELRMRKKKYVTLLGTLSNAMQEFPSDTAQISHWVSSVLSLILGEPVGIIEKFDQLSAAEDRIKRAISHEKSDIEKITSDAVVSSRIETSMTYMRRIAALAGIALATYYASMYGKGISDIAKNNYDAIKGTEKTRDDADQQRSAARDATAAAAEAEAAAKIARPVEAAAARAAAAVAKEAARVAKAAAAAAKEAGARAAQADVAEAVDTASTAEAVAAKQAAVRAREAAATAKAAAVPAPIPAGAVSEAASIPATAAEVRDAARAIALERVALLTPDQEALLRDRGEADQAWGGPAMNVLGTKLGKIMLSALNKLEYRLDELREEVKPEEFMKEMKRTAEESLEQVKEDAEAIFSDVKVEAEDKIDMVQNKTNMVLYEVQKVRGTVYSGTAIASGLGLTYWYIKRAMSKNGAVYTAMKKNFQDMIYILTGNQLLTPENLGNLIYFCKQLREHASAVLSHDELELLSRDLDHIIDPSTATLSKLETLKFMQKSYSFLAQKQAIII